MDLKELFIQAIKERRYVKLWYEGGDRIIIPCCVGIGNSGNKLLRCWQQSGYTESGQDWHLFILPKMVNVSLLHETFRDIPVGYKKGDRAFKIIWAEL